MKLVSIVSGCYNEEDNLEELVRRVRDVMTAMLQYDYEMIIIDNASTDGSPRILRQLALEDKRIKVIFNARNFGHVRSPYYALMQAKGDAVIFLASDLQDPPEMFPQFLEKWEAGSKAVVAVKEQSEETALFFLVRRAYYKIISRLSDNAVIQNFTGFGLYDHRIIEICRELCDPYPYFRGMISDIGLPVATIPFRQPLRKRGITKGNFYILYDLAMLGITNHSKVPLRLAAMLGFIMSILSLLVAVVYFIYKLLFWYNLTVGIAPLVIGLFLFSSVQLFFIGILGEYIGSIHTQVMHRPLVVEKERINF